MNTTNNNNNWQDKHKILLNLTTTEVSKGATIYSGKVHILTELLQELLVLHSGHEIKKFLLPIAPKYAKTPKYSIIPNDTQ